MSNESGNNVHVSRRTVLGAAGVAGLGWAARGVVAPPATAEAATPNASEPSASAGVVLFDPDVDKLFASTDHEIVYTDFRTPAICTTQTSAGAPSTLVAFCEGRANGGGDWGDIDLTYKVSVDNGRTWSALQSVISADGDPANGYTNSTPVFDPATRVLWFWHMRQRQSATSYGGLKKGERTLYVASTTVDAQGRPTTWKFGHPSLDSLQITQPIEDGSWWDNVGPGNGICLRDGTLVIPARGRNLVSTDHGTTWVNRWLTGSSEATAVRTTDESTVTERTTTDGRGALYRNDRATTNNYWEVYHQHRAHAIGSLSGGFTFTESRLNDPQNTYATVNDEVSPHTYSGTPACQASVLRYNFAKSGGADWQRMLFLNPSSSIDRADMRIRVSYDNGINWTTGRLLADSGLPSSRWNVATDHEGGYSSMARTAVPDVVALTEGWRKINATWVIIVRHLNLAWILDGATEPTPPPQ